MTRYRSALTVGATSAWRESERATSQGLLDHCPIIAQDLDGVRVGVEDARPHAGGGEQHAQDPSSYILRPRGFDPTELGVGEIRVGRNEPLQEEAQGNAQREGEDYAAQDQEIQQIPAEVEPEPHGAEEEDGSEQVCSDYRGAAVAVDGELFLPGPQAP